MTSTIQKFFAALIYFTRIPSPVRLDPNSAQGASAFAPLIGYVVAGFVLVVCWLSAQLMPPLVVVALTMIAGIWLTGAMHEDGWSDFCDGFGGGWDKAQTLEIMRDPRTGVFGVAGLLCLLGLKYVCLLALFDILSVDGQLTVAFAFTVLTGHTASRFLCVSFMATHDYASSAEPGRAQTMTHRLSLPGLVVIGIVGLAPVVPLALTIDAWIWGLVPLLLVCRWVFSTAFTRRLGGYTGDCLGAAQQVSEVLVYLGVLAVLGR